MEENLPDASQNGKMRDRHFLRVICVIVILLHHAEYGSATTNTVKPTISMSASTTKEPGTLGLIGAFIAVSVVMLIGLVLLIIIICRMKKKIKILKATISSIRDGEAVSEFEKKTEDDVHKKTNANVNEHRDLHEKPSGKKDTNHKQTFKLPEPRNPTDVIISPNSLVESIKIEFKDIPQKFEVQDNDTGDYPNNASLPEMEKLKMPTNDFKVSSARALKFDSSVNGYSNESEEINDQKACRVQETEFTEKMDKVVMVDVDLSHDESASEIHAEHGKNKLQEVERGITKVSNENERADEDDSLYESYDYSSREQKATANYTTTMQNPFNSKGTNIPPNDDDMIEEFVYADNQSGEIDTKNTNQRDVLAKNAKPGVYHDEAIYEEPVSSKLINSGNPTFSVPDIQNRSMFSMTLQNTSGKQFKAEVHTMTESFSNESIVTNSISENVESNQKAERSVSDVTASRASPELPKAPKRKRKVAPKSSVSPSEGAAKISIDGDM
ncbi:hypothetical protein ACJMK2_042562 [Sinanodonta woodiana]|uniref:Uncharacterized protein n=1 Tax=Sinanodonta woodiana TaxID=1069815 RepID=A0ABD3W7R3_SINWO